MAQKYVCKKCGSAAELFYKGGCTPSCCGEPMALVEAKTEDASKEKHVIGKEALHPMTEEHYIVFIEIVADGVHMRRYLKPGDAPEAVFTTDAKDIVAFEYCNKHGLWTNQ